MEIGKHAEQVFHKAMERAVDTADKKHTRELAAAEVKRQTVELSDRAMELADKLIEKGEIDFTSKSPIPHSNWIPVTDTLGEYPKFNSYINVGVVGQPGHLEQVYIALQMKSVEIEDVQPEIPCYLRFKKGDVKMTVEDGSQYSIKPGTKDWDIATGFLRVIEDFLETSK